MWREMARIIHEVRPRFVFVENSPMLTSRGLGTVLGDLAAMGFDARWGVLGAADVGAPHQRDRIWIRGGKKVFYCKKCGYEFETGRITKFGCPKCKSTQPEIIEMANTKKLFCDGGNDNTGVSVEREQISELRNNGWKKNVSNTNGFGDAMRRDGQNYAESMARWGNEFRRSISDSWPGCKEISREGSSMDNPDCTQREGNKRAFRIRTQYTNIGSASWWQTEPNVGRVADGVAARVDRLKAIGNGQVPLVAATAWEDLGDKK
jgi:DNA (cytosine-5)-methyltransferase 1